MNNMKKIDDYILEGLKVNSKSKFGKYLTFKSWISANNFHEPYIGKNIFIVGKNDLNTDIFSKMISREILLEEVYEGLKKDIISKYNNEYYLGMAKDFVDKRIILTSFISNGNGKSKFVGSLEILIRNKYIEIKCNIKDDEENKAIIEDLFVKVFIYMINYEI